MASQNVTVSISGPIADYVERQVREGRFRSADEMIQAALQRLEQDEARFAELDAALAAGEASGPAREFDFDAFLASKRKQ